MADAIRIGAGGKAISMEVEYEGERHLLTLHLGNEFTIATLKDFNGALVAYVRQHGNEIVTF